MTWNCNRSLTYYVKIHIYCLIILLLVYCTVEIMLKEANTIKYGYGFQEFQKAWHSEESAINKHIEINHIYTLFKEIIKS